MTYTVKFGKMLDTVGEYAPAVVWLDRRDGSPPVSGNNLDDGTGHYDIASTTGTDFLVMAVPSGSKCGVVEFNLSRTQDPDPAKRPVGVTFDPATGELNIIFPFVAA